MKEMTVISRTAKLLVSRDYFGSVETSFADTILIENKNQITKEQYVNFIVNKLLALSNDYSESELNNTVAGLELLITWQDTTDSQPKICFQSIFLETDNILDDAHDNNISFHQALIARFKRFECYPNVDIIDVVYPVRAATLTGAKSWTNPTGTEVNILAKECCGMNILQVAEFIGVGFDRTKGDSTTVRTWYRGSRAANGSAIPYSAWSMLVERAGLGLIQYRR